MGIKRKLVLEAPDFGFGPASSLLAVYEEIGCASDCVIVTTGASLEFIRKAQPGAKVIDLETFTPSSWKILIGLLSGDTVLVCNTNPQLAAWALGEGARVAVVDTLFWMWDELPDSLEGAEVYVAHSYFGQRAIRNERRDGRTGFPVTWVRPRETRQERRRGDPSDGNVALFSFGGMGMPLDAALPAEYARWVLEIAVGVLMSSGRVDKVVVVGGHRDLATLVPLPYRNDARVDVKGIVPPTEYLQLMRTSAFQFLTPGLATIYEANYLDIEPMFLPAYNMSMLLQSWDYAHGSVAGVGTVHEWSWSADVVREVRHMCEARGVAMMSSRIRSTVAGGTATADGAALARAVKLYTENKLDGPPRFKGRLMQETDLPSAGAVLRRALRLNGTEIW